jgi:hypothetical protein
VDGVALKSQVKQELGDLDQLLFTKVADALGAAATGGGYTATSAQDSATGNFLCGGGGGSPPSFAFMVAPSASAIGEPQPPSRWRALTTLWLTIPGLTGASECTSAGALATTTYDGSAPISVSLNGLRARSTSAPLFPPGSIIAKSIWNEALLHNDQTWGVHNLPFFLSVVENTASQLETLP